MKLEDFAWMLGADWCAKHFASNGISVPDRIGSMSWAQAFDVIISNPVIVEWCDEDYATIKMRGHPDPEKRFLRCFVRDLPPTKIYLGSTASSTTQTYGVFQMFGSRFHEESGFLYMEFDLNGFEL